MPDGDILDLGAEFELFGRPAQTSNMTLFHREGAAGQKGEALLIDYEGNIKKGRPRIAEEKLLDFIVFAKRIGMLGSPDWRKRLVVTHAHIDHHGNHLDSAIEERSFELIMHRNTYIDLRCRTRDVDLFGKVRQEQALVNHDEFHPSVTVLEADEQLELENGDVIQLIHVPHAHTDGDLVVHFVSQNYIVTGDIFFNLQYPFIDPLNGGSFSGMIAGMKMIAGLADSETIIVPGHGIPAGKSAIEEAVHMLTTIRHRIHTLMAAGIDLEDIVNIHAPTLDFDQRWATGLISPRRLIEQLYKEREKDLVADAGGDASGTSRT